MEKAKAMRVKRLPSDQFHIRVVKIISDQRKTKMFHMDADLVCASGLQDQRNEGKSVLFKN